MVEHVADGQPGVQVFVLIHLVNLALLPPSILKISDLLNCLRVGAGPFRCAERRSDVKSASAVVHVEVVFAHKVAVIVDLSEQTVVQAEAVAHGLFRRYADDRRNAGVITSTGIGDNLHIFYVVRAQTVKLRVVPHLASVDVKLWRSPSKHLYFALPCRDVRYAVEQALYGSGVLKQGSAHARYHALALQARLGHIALHHHFAQHLRHGFKADGTHVVAAVGVNRLVTERREAQQAAFALGVEGESAVVGGHNAGDEGRVGQREGHHVGVRQGLSAAVNDASRHRLRRQRVRQKRATTQRGKSGKCVHICHLS